MSLANYTFIMNTTTKQINYHTFITLMWLNGARMEKDAYTGFMEYTCFQT